LRIRAFGPARSSVRFDPTAEIFSTLDRWRHLPTYQLERRADIFLAIQRLVGEPLLEVMNL
jgi:hypothetical protein